MSNVAPNIIMIKLVRGDYFRKCCDFEFYTFQKAHYYSSIANCMLCAFFMPPTLRHNVGGI